MIGCVIEHNYREGDEKFGREFLGLKSSQKITEKEPTLIRS